MTVHRLADSVLSQTRREFSEALTSQSLEDIARIEKISALSMESWNENERYSAARRSEPEHLIGAIVRQFPTPESQYRYEEIFFIALLYYGFPNPRPFSEPKMTEDFKANIDTAAHRFLPESKWGSVKKSLLVPIEKFEVPYANRWILAPSLQNLSRAVRAAPVIEKIFKIFLFSRFYIGTGAENARKTWERIRRIELANVGNDSLGMYPGNAIF